MVCHCHFGCSSLPIFADLRCIELHQLELCSTLPSPFQALAIHHAAHCGAPALEALLARGFAVDHRPPLSVFSSFRGSAVTKIRFLNRAARWFFQISRAVQPGDPQGRSPLHLAVDGLGVRVLLEAKAMVDEGSH